MQVVEFNCVVSLFLSFAMGDGPRFAAARQRLCPVYLGFDTPIALLTL
jgi:hypothetical protein